jgi:hypothetical protein
MGRTLAAFAVAASLLTLASSEASAWVCYATGVGSSGYARAYDISTPSFLRYGDASAAVRCRSAHLCGAVPVADE